MNYRLFLSLFFFVSQVSPAGMLSAEIWEDADFLDRFTASYGVRGSQEPQVTREEQNVLREVATHMPHSPEEAADALEEVLGDESSAALDFTLGNLRFQLDDFDRAQGHYRDAIKKFPDFLRAHKNVGLVLIRQNEYGEALDALRRALTLGSADGDTYGLIGFAHLRKDRWVSAEAAYRQALLFEEDNSNWQIGLVRALQAQERHSEAAALLGELTSRWPERADYWTYQANTYIALDRPMKAVANLELVRRMGNLRQDALLLLADIYVNEELPELALGGFQEAFESGATVPFRRAARAAERLAQREHFAEAGQLLTWIEQQSLDELSSKDQGDLRRLQARLALSEEREDEARPLLEEALEANPLDGESHLLLAKLMAPVDLERAEVLLEQAARLPDVAVRAFRQHGEMLVGERRYGEALIPLREAQMVDPRPALREYIERVERLADASADHDGS